jgi:hypothetical protein
MKAGFIGAGKATRTFGRHFDNHSGARVSIDETFYA